MQITRKHQKEILDQLITTIGTHCMEHSIPKGLLGVFLGNRKGRI